MSEITIYTECEKNLGPWHNEIKIRKEKGAIMFFAKDENFIYFYPDQVKALKKFLTSRKRGKA